MIFSGNPDFCKESIKFNAYKQSILNKTLRVSWICVSNADVSFVGH